jgi:hypothetical protein
MTQPTSEAPQWFYMRGQERNGPVGEAELRAVVARGGVQPQDLVWCEGMAQWTAAAQVPALSSAFGASPAPVAGVPMGYYTPSMGLPPRAVANLRGHARPTGDTGDWPLDDPRVNQFQQAVAIRKRVTAAANLYRALLFLSIIGGVIVLAVGAFTYSGGGGRAARGAGIAMLVVGAMMAGFALLYYFAARATMRAQRWAPLTMFILFVVGIVFSFANLFVARGGATPPEALIGVVVSFVLYGAFAIVSWRSFAAIRPYLAQPAWCQELIVKAGL